MSTRQNDRVYRVTAYRQNPITNALSPAFFEELPNGVQITEHRMQCRIEKTLKSEPNTCELVLTNLAEHTRAEFERLPLRVKVEAGYQGVPRLMFIGDVRPGFTRSRLVGTDWETTVNLGDGLRAFAEGEISRSYKPGTPVKSILRDVARSLNLGLPRDLEIDPALQQALSTGETVFGWSADELTRLLAPYGYSWSMQNGTLQVLRDDAALPNRERAIGPHTGMVDSPEHGVPDKKGNPPSVTVRHLLYPEVTPGERVRLFSLGTERSYKVVRVGHVLDTDGEDWTTEIEAKPL